MRQKLNENPVAQIVLVAVLLLVVGVFVMSSMGGGEGAGSGAEVVPVVGPEEAAAGLEGSAPVASASAVAAPAPLPLPQDLKAAYEGGKTVVLLIYRPGGIDDRRLSDAAEVLKGMPNVAFFSAPATEITRYADITGPLGVNQTPALIVVQPRGGKESGTASATVDYGFRSAADVRQAVVDAGYHGPELTYAPK